MLIKLLKINVGLFILLLVNTSIYAQDENGTLLSASAVLELCDTDCEEPDCTNNFFRSINGSCNNLNNPIWGASGTNMLRIAPANYDGDQSTLVDYGNPRTISNIVCQQSESILDERGLSSMMYSWLQFIDHDITIIGLGEETADILIPVGDSSFDPFFTGTQSMGFTRSAIHLVDGVRKHENEITAWIDASNVYGSDTHRANWLRTHVDGKLKISTGTKGDLLPYNTLTGEASGNLDPNAPRMDGDRDDDGNQILAFVAGDIRAMEQPTLTSIHTLFVREHNRICDDLIAEGYSGDNWIYEVARAKIIGLIQSITYYEALPALGLPDFGTAFYQPNLIPNLSHEFSSAAYRLGHSMLPTSIFIREENCEEATYNFRETSATGEISLRDAFFNPEVVSNNGIDAIFKGICAQTQQKIDAQIIDDVRNFLFGPPGAGGMDLVSLNIQRGRDHGLADFNTIRVNLGLDSYTDFSQITSDLDVENKLRTAYNNDIDKIDAWVGMISEDHLQNSSVGETISAILFSEFQDLRNGDRFWFERNLLLTGKILEIKNTKLADVLMRNTGCKNLSDVFFSDPCSISTPLPEEYCESGGDDSSYEWLEEVHFYNNNQQLHLSENENGYADFTYHTFDMTGSQYSIFKLVPGSLFDDPHHFKIWIDYNLDGDFDDSREWVYASYNIVGEDTGFFYFPSDIYNGTYRMRIAINYGNPWFGPCETFQYGEVEDYLINVDIGNGERQDVVLPTNEELQPPSIIVENISLFPNPTTDLINVSLNSRGEETETSFNLTNSVGQLVHSQINFLREGENLVTIDFSNEIQPGIYYLSILRSNQRMVTRKLVIVD